MSDSESVPTRPPADGAPDRLPTGVELLDRKLGGGLLPGSVALLSASPASQSELLCYELAAPRPTLYLSPVRSPASVRRTLARLDRADDGVVVAGVDEARPVASTLALVEALPSPATLVVDPVEPFERLPPARYWSFVRALRERLVDRDAVGVFHALDGDRPAPARDLTAYLADAVLDVRTERRGESVETTLTVPKFRGGRAVDDVIKLSLTTEVDVDISRNIV